jgi:CO/xanthine dehydrogenase Mo-binding subunit
MSAPARTRVLRRGRAEAKPRRHDAVPKVNGEFAYSSDLQAAGMLWGQTVRSPHAHARIRSIDARASSTSTSGGGKAGRNAVAQGR